MVIEWIKTCASEINLPTLFVHGANDPLLDVFVDLRFFKITYPDTTSISTRLVDTKRKMI
jgi:hypothetical protein